MMTPLRIEPEPMITNPSALTLIRPWAYAIAHLGKTIENRSWACPLPPGSIILIHAGQRWDPTAEAFIKRFQPDAILPTAKTDTTGIVAIARFKANCTDSPSPWFTGPIGWELELVAAIEPVLCSGSQKLWYPSAAIVDQIPFDFGK
jgi:hypothetical protein